MRQKRRRPVHTDAQSHWAIPSLSLSTLSIHTDCYHRSSTPSPPSYRQSTAPRTFLRARTPSIQHRRRRRLCPVPSRCCTVFADLSCFVSDSAFLRGGDFPPCLSFTMDSQTSFFNSGSQRRKLVKKNPSHSYTRSSSGFDVTGNDRQSLQSQRSSQSLRRAPSAPHVRSNHSLVSGNSSPRHPQAPTSAASIFRPNPSPAMSPGDLGPSANNSTTLPYRSNRLSDTNLGGFDNGAPSAATDDFIGAPFDGAAVLNRLDGNPSASNRPISIQRQNIPPPLKSQDSYKSTTSQSTSTFGKMDVAMDRPSPAIRGTDSPPLGNVKRFSDDGRDLKTSMLRKKTGGLSGFVNSLVGSPKKPAISAPENPVHVTHVGYDSSTGQFTVGF